MAGSRAAARPRRRAALGYSAIAITDECSVAGVVRAHGEAKKHGLQLLPGAEFLVQCQSPTLLPFRLVVLPHNCEGWGNLCEFITQAKAAGDIVEKGSYSVTPESDFSRLQDCEVILCIPQGAIDTEAACAHISWLKSIFIFNSRLTPSPPGGRWDGGARDSSYVSALAPSPPSPSGGGSQGQPSPRLWLAVELLQGLDDALRLQQLQRLSQQSGVPLVACGGVLMHVRSRKPLHDVLTAVGMGCTVHDCGFALAPNAEAH